MMKKVVLWLIKVFRLDIPTEKMIEKKIYILDDETIEGDVTIKGNLLVKGYLIVEGEVTCYKRKEV